MYPPNSFDLPIFHKTYLLLVAITLYIAKFPKHRRYTIGERIERLGIDFLTFIIRANGARGDERVRYLNEASTLLDLLKMMFRLACDTKALPEKGYLNLSTRANEIGKQLGGWIKSCKPT
jgi:hypothetical protein